MPVAALSRMAAVELALGAELVETDPARWHWLRTVERAKNPRDVLHPLAPLVERLAASPLVSRFYSVMSLHRLCFSASSHYPWVGHESPMATASRTPGRYWVDEHELGLEAAVSAIEERLGAWNVEPFFGTGGHDLRTLVVRLAALESPATVRMMQRDSGSTVEVEGRTATCAVSDRGITILGARTLHTSVRDAALVPSAVHRLCALGETPEALEAEGLLIIHRSGEPG